MAAPIWKEPPTGSVAGYYDMCHMCKTYYAAGVDYCINVACAIAPDKCHHMLHCWQCKRRYWDARGKVWASDFKSKGEPLDGSC